MTSCLAFQSCSQLSRAVMSDVWDADTRGKALALFTLAPFAGPTLGPTVSGFMAVAGVSWRWVFWLLTFFAGTCLIVTFFTLPETFVYVFHPAVRHSARADNKCLALLSWSNVRRSCGRRPETTGIGLPSSVAQCLPVSVSDTSSAALSSCSRASPCSLRSPFT